MVNSKLKGKKFENTVYNVLLKKGFVVKKPLGSGGYGEPGDVIVYCGGRVFCLECKCYHRLSSGQKLAFFDNHKSLVRHHDGSWVPVLVVKLDRVLPEVLLGVSGGVRPFGCFTDFVEYLGELK